MDRMWLISLNLINHSFFIWFENSKSEQQIDYTMIIDDCGMNIE